MNAFDQLERLSIDGMLLPVLERSGRFQGESARHKFQFKNGELVDQLGSRNFIFSYTIPFRQGIAKGPYQDLFTRVLPRFVQMCRRAMSETVVLRDPIHGTFDVTCVSFDEVTDNNKRDGTDVRVEFLHSPSSVSEAPAESPLLSISGARSEAGALDASAGRLLANRQKPPPEPLVNPLDAISGLIKQVELRGNQVQARIADFSSRVEKLENSIAALEEPDLQPTIRSLRNLRDNAEKMESRAANPIANLQRFTTTNVMTVSELASSLGVDTSVLIEQNPALAKRAPEVPVGTTVAYEGQP